jgi:TonB family protein
MENNNETAGRWVDDQLNKLNPDSEWHPDATNALSAFRERTASAKANWQRVVWAVGLVAVTSAAVLAIPASRVFAERCIAACQNLFADDDQTHVVAVSEIAPDFAVKDSNGATVRLSDYRGKAVLLNFWASWCPPCNTEIPWFEEFSRTYANQGFEVVGVAMDEDGWTSVKPYMEKLRMNYPVVLGNEALARLYGADNLPTTFLIDGGRVIAKHLGIVNKNDYEAEIVALLGQKPQWAGSGGVGVPSCLSCPPPQYSEEARKAHFEGDVFVSAVVGADGRATKLKVLNFPPFGLGKKAKEAVQKWVFKPATGPDGKPVAVTTTIQTHFSL